MRPGRRRRSPWRWDRWRRLRPSRCPSRSLRAATTGMSVFGRRQVRRVSAERDGVAVYDRHVLHGREAKRVLAVPDLRRADAVQHVEPARQRADQFRDVDDHRGREGELRRAEPDRLVDRRVGELADLGARTGSPMRARPRSAGTALSSITVGSQTTINLTGCRADQPHRVHGIAVGAIGSGSHRGQLPADHCRRFEPGRRPHRHLHGSLSSLTRGRPRPPRPGSTPVVRRSGTTTDS